MNKLLVLAAACALGACAVTGEETQQLDVTDPKFAISVNGKIAYSTLSQTWGPITCDDGSVPPFVFTPGAGVPPGITVPLQEQPGIPTFPIEVNLLAGDDSGIKKLRVTAPPGPISSQAMINSFQHYTELVKNFSAPLTTTENLTYRYSRTDTPRVRHTFEVTDGAANANKIRFLVDIVPESEVCP